LLPKLKGLEGRDAEGCGYRRAKISKVLLTESGLNSRNRILIRGLILRGYNYHVNAEVTCSKLTVLQNCLCMQASVPLQMMKMQARRLKTTLKKKTRLFYTAPKIN
jgi:hypothetical protein